MAKLYAAHASPSKVRPDRASCPRSRPDKALVGVAWTRDQGLLVTGKHLNRLNRPQTRKQTPIPDGMGEAVVPRGNEGPVFRATFSPDGARVVTASKDGTARVWLVRAEDLLERADRRLAALGRDFTSEELERYGELLPPESIESARRSWEEQP